MHGMMMDRPLLISSILEHAALQSGATAMVSHTGDLGAHRTSYAQLARRARQLANALQRALRHRHRRSHRHARLERPPPFRAVLRRRRHRRDLPHHQSPAVPRADRLHHQPRRGLLPVRRSDVRAAGGAPSAPAADGARRGGAERCRAHAGKRARPSALPTRTCSRASRTASTGRSSTRPRPRACATPPAPPATRAAPSTTIARRSCTA